MGVRGSKPGERRGGRVKGTPNKVTSTLKTMILGALDDAGGRAYLLRMANQQPKAFLSLLGRVLPQEVKGEFTGENGAPLQVTIYMPHNGR